MINSKAVRLSKKGRFVIPQEMRKALGVKEGDELLATLLVENADAYLTNDAGFRKLKSEGIRIVVLDDYVR